MVMGNTYCAAILQACKVWLVQHYLVTFYMRSREFWSILAHRYEVPGVLSVYPWYCARPHKRDAIVGLW